MSLSGRAKIRLNAKMDLQGVTLEPAAASFRQMRGLCHFWDAKDASVEAAGGVLFSWRHGELDMVQCFYPHGNLTK
jgi:hypothetical protein